LLFLQTDDFWRDYLDMLYAGIKVIRASKNASDGARAVFEDLSGN